MDGEEVFVGRTDATLELCKLFTNDRPRKKLVIQSIEGPGGIGKTRLLEHVLNRSDLDGVLQLRLQGSSAPQTLASILRSIAGSATWANAGLPTPVDIGHFPRTVRLAKQIEAEEEKVRQAAAESGSPELADLAVRLLDVCIAAGKTINEVAPKSKEYVDLEAVDGEKLASMVRRCLSVSVTVWETLSRGRSSDWKTAGPRAIANAVLEDLLRAVAGRGAFQRPSRSRLPGIKQVLLVLDDYEFLQPYIEGMLTEFLLPRLAVAAEFNSVVAILGRDHLSATSPAWEQHLSHFLQRPITLKHLSREELEELLSKIGFDGSASDLESAWRDTEGYPYYVNLWVEEFESGTGPALTLKKFYDRTTRWMSTAQKQWLSYVVFLDSVDRRSVAKFDVLRDQAEEVCAWFQSEASIRDTSAATFTVRPYVRSRVLKYLQLTDPQHVEETSRIAAAP